MGLRIASRRAAVHRPALLPQPEEVFLSWLMMQPDGADLVVAADVELDRLSRYSGPHPGPQKLAELFRHFRYCLGVDPAALSTARHGTAGRIEEALRVMRLV